MISRRPIPNDTARSSANRHFAVGALLIFALTQGFAAEEGSGGLPFPNDAGPTTVDVSSYPARIQADYRVFARRCSQCHTLARPINSQNLQLTPKEQQTARMMEPDIFKDEQVWRISDGVWLDYFTRMYMKPGASFRVRPTESDQIVEFLVYDSKARKMGGHREAWRAERQKLLDDFKISNPKRYEELFGK